MDIDITSHLGGATREVQRRERDGRSARVVVATRTYDTTAEDLWEALTDPERLPRWFLPVHGDLRVGGRFQIEGNAGGEVLTCDPPRHLGITWEYGGDVTWVDVRLGDDPDGGTRLELEHVAHVGDDLWDQFGPGAVGVGWDLALLGLDLHLASGEAVDPAQVMAWQETDDGRAFMRAASDGWGEAAIAAGDPPEAARASAERTFAFYTGAEPTEG